MDDQVIESGASSPEGSASPESASPAQSQDAGSQQDAAAGSKDTNNVSPNTPFDQHPRFRELIAQKNEQAQALAQYQKDMQELRSQLEQMQKSSSKMSEEQRAKDELIERLKSIDPVFGSRFEETERYAREFQEYRQQMQMQESGRQVYSRLDQLYKENKVPESYRSAYEAHIKSLAYENPNASVQDLDKYFKQVHSAFDSIRRAERESYVKERGAASTPATQSGGSPAPTTSTAGFKDLNEVKQAILREARASTQKV